MKKTILLLLIIFISHSLFSQTSISLDKVNGVYIIPCKVNGIPMKFIFDTGASNVTISLTEATFLIKQGLLSKNDIKESVKYQIANGDINEGTQIILREIEVSGMTLNNVTATVVHEQNAPLLLGMSALSQLGKIEIENNKLVINDFSYKNTEKPVDLEQEVKGTIDWINSKFVQYQYENSDVRQLQDIHSVMKIENEFYLFGSRTQDTDNPLAYFSKGFLIPLNKINNIDFAEKKFNYWLEIRMKENEKAIMMVDNNDNKDYIDRIQFMLDKSIDNENLKPKLKRAFEYLIELYANKPEKKSSIDTSKKNEEITIRYTNGLEIFNVYSGNNEPEFIEDKDFYWYTKFSKIKSTKGGSGGQLLDGNYKFYDENGNLKINENYSMGLKNGESKKWNSDGELTEIIRYEKGESVYWKYHPEDDEGWVEQIGQMLKDGWIKNSYNKYGTLIAKQETFINNNSKIQKLKLKLHYIIKTRLKQKRDSQPL